MYEKPEITNRTGSDDLKRITSYNLENKVHEEKIIRPDARERDPAYQEAMRIYKGLPFRTNPDPKYAQRVLQYMKQFGTSTYELGH